MSKAKAIVEAAVFEALAAHVTRGTVWQDAPFNAPGNLVILGDLKSARLSGKDASADRRVTVTIATIAIAEERAPLLAMQEECEAALDGQTLTRDGWRLDCAFVDDDAVLDDEGAGYVGLATFEILALAP